MDKLLAIATIGRGVYGGWLLQRVLSGIIMVAVLVIITTMLVSALLIGGLYGVYYTLLYYGVEAPQAMLATGGAGALLVALFLAFIALALRQLRRMPKHVFGRDIITARINETVDAFIDGFMAEEKR